MAYVHRDCMTLHDTLDSTGSRVHSPDSSSSTAGSVCQLPKLLLQRVFSER